MRLENVNMLPYSQSPYTLYIYLSLFDVLLLMSHLVDDFENIDLEI